MIHHVRGALPPRRVFDWSQHTRLRKTICQGGDAMGERIVVDTDLSANFDDAFALALAVVSPELEVQGVTTTGFYPKESAALARRIMDLYGGAQIRIGVGDSPRYKQANRPLNLFKSLSQALDKGVPKLTALEWLVQLTKPVSPLHISPQPR